MDTRGSGKKYYKEIDKMDCLKRTGNQLVPVSCLGFGNSGKYCFVSQHKQYSKEYLSFIYICSNFGMLACRRSSSLCSLWPHGIFEKKVAVLESFNFHHNENIWNLGWPCIIFCSLDRQFSADEVLQLLGRFFNLEMLVIWETWYLNSLCSFYSGLIFVWMIGIN